jgi:hypothetical protein
MHEFALQPCVGGFRRAGKSRRNLAQYGLQHLVIATPQYGHLSSQGDLDGD